MIDAPKGLQSLLAILEAQKSRGWAHNEFDYFKPCPTCGHWFDCRHPETHKHAPTASIVVTAIVRTSTGQIYDSNSLPPNSPPGIASDALDKLPKTPTGSTKR